MQNGGGVWRIVVEARANHPADLTVWFDSFANETCISRENKVAFQTPPDEMKLVAIGPDVGSRALDRVFIFDGIIRRVTGVKRTTDVGLIGECAQRGWLINYQGSSNQKYNQTVHGCASCKIM